MSSSKYNNDFKYTKKFMTLVFSKELNDCIIFFQQTWNYRNLTVS